MVAQKIQSFGGMIPAVDERLLQPSSAAHSENVWLYSGRLQGFPKPTLLTSLIGGTSKVFRLPLGEIDGAHISDSYWMSFPNPDTDVVRGAVIGDTYDRYYVADSLSAPRYNTRARILNADNYYLLGVPRPDAPSVSPSGGSSAILESRAYVTTWVTTYGEEGPASEPFVVTGKVDDTWAVTLDAAATDDTNGVDRIITLARIYRTITGSDGVTVFFRVAEQAVADTSYDDTQTDDIVAANAQLESTNWIGPPDDLQGIVQMPNGILAGWVNDQVWFCEPYRPHAWPAAYSISVPYPIVGMGVAGQTLIVCTQGYPVAISGIAPATMAQSIIKSLEPCSSRGSIVSTMEGVYYASPNGLVLAGGGQIKNLTTELLTKDRWRSYVSVPTLRAGRIGSAYYAFGAAYSAVFDPDSFDDESFALADYAGSYAGLLIDPANGRVGFNLMSSFTPVTNVFNDQWSGELLLIRDGNLYHVDVSQNEFHAVRTPYLWRTKMFQTNLPENLGAMRVYFDTPEGGTFNPGSPPAQGGSRVEFPEITGSVNGVVRCYADGELVMTRNLNESGELIRLPSGFKANFYQFEFETWVDIWNVQIGSSAKALKGA